MAYSGRVPDYLGQGLAADRPATLNLAPGCIGFWRSTDTGELSVWSDDEWSAVGGGSASIPDNSITGAKLSASVRTLNASGTAEIGDAFNAVQMDVATANTFTIPPNSAVAFAVGDPLEVWQKGDGQTTIVAGVGVTILYDDEDLTLKIKRKNCACSLRKVDTNTWRLVGDMEPI